MPHARGRSAAASRWLKRRASACGGRGGCVHACLLKIHQRTPSPAPSCYCLPAAAGRIVEGPYQPPVEPAKSRPPPAFVVDGVARVRRGRFPLSPPLARRRCRRPAPSTASQSRCRLPGGAAAALPHPAPTPGCCPGLLSRPAHPAPPQHHRCPTRLCRPSLRTWRAAWKPSCDGCTLRARTEPTLGWAERLRGRHATPGHSASSGGGRRTSAQLQLQLTRRAALLGWQPMLERAAGRRVLRVRGSPRLAASGPPCPAQPRPSVLPLRACAGARRPSCHHHTTPLHPPC